MIVKIQRSIYSTEGDRCIVYNEDRSICWEGKTPKSIKKLMSRANKLFFHAEVINKELVIGGKAPWQDW